MTDRVVVWRRANGEFELLLPDIVGSLDGYKIPKLDKEGNFKTFCVMCKEKVPAAVIAEETGEGLCIVHKLNNDEARRGYQKPK